MSVKTRLFLLVIFLILIILISILAAWSQENTYLQVAFQDRQAQVDLFVQHQVAADAQTLEYLTRDLANSLVPGETPASTPPPDLKLAFDRTQLDSVWIFDSQNELVSNYHKEETKRLDHELTFLADLFEQPELLNSGLHFFALSTNGEVVELFGLAVSSPSASTQPALPHYVFGGQHWDVDHLGRISSLADGQAKLLPVTEEYQPSAQNSIGIPNEITTRYPLLSWDGQPLLIALEVRTELPVMQAVLKMRDIDTRLNIIFGLLFTFVTGLALYLWIYIPLKKTFIAMDTGQMQPLEGMLKSPTEFGRLAQLIQRSFQQKIEIEKEISRREMVEQELLGSEMTYRSLVENSIQGFAICQKGAIVFANLTLADSLGYSTEDLIGLKEGWIAAIFHADYHVTTRTYLRNTLAGDETKLRQKVKMVRKDGGVCWMEILATRIEHDYQPAVQIAFLDVTTRVQAETAFRGEQEFARAILNTVNSIVVVLNPSGRMARCNPACEQVTGCAFEEMKDRYLWDVFRLVKDADVFEIDFQKMVSERIVMNQERAFSIDEKPPIWISWSYEFMLGEDGEVLYVVGTGVDVTERKKRERDQEAIAGLGSELHGMLTRSQTMKVIVNQAIKFNNYEAVGVLMLRPEKGDFVVESAAGALASSLLGWSMSSREGIAAQVLGIRKPYFNNDLSAGEHLLRPDLEAKLCAGAWVPLEAEGSLIGLLFAFSRKEIELSDFQLLSSIADIAADAIQRCILADGMQRQLQRLTALHTINIAISASLDIPVTLQLLVSQITSQLGVDAAEVLLVDSSSRDLKFAAGHGFRSREVQNTRYWMGEGKPGQVALYRRALNLYDTAGIAPDFPQAAWMGDENFVAYEGVPLINKGEVKGILETFHRAPYTPDPDWLRFLELLAMQTAIALNNADLLDKLQRSNLELEQAYDATIEGWAYALELRDQETEGHTQRVAEWTMHMAQGMGFSGDDITHLRRGALLHDIGKMGIPDSILLKNGPLNAEEWVIMRRHPQYAYDMLSSIEFLHPAISIPYSHHERWDGSGYPQGLKTQEIPLPARIFAVIDVWDALFYGRFYKPAWPEQDVVNYLRQESGKLFDPEIVDTFLQLRSVMDKHS